MNVTKVVRYAAGESDVEVRFEIEPPVGYRQVGAAEVIGRVRAAVEPAVLAARDVLDRVKALSPAEVEVKFGIKVSGEAGWIVAKTAGEANFEVTLTWKSEAGGSPPEEAGDGGGSRTVEAPPAPTQAPAPAAAPGSRAASEAERSGR